VTATATAPAPASAPADARGRWRFTVHRRDFTGGAPASATGITELVGARSRRLETTANAPAKLTFTMDGRSKSSFYVQELTTDVLAWRTRDDGADKLMARAIVAQPDDTVSEKSHTVNFTCHDYLAMLARRQLTGRADVIYTQTDQDDIVADLLARATVNMTTADGISLYPGSSLPLAVALVNPDGTARAHSGVLRDRTYTGGSWIGELIANLAAVQGGFDFDCQANADGADQLRIFYGAQGVTRTDLMLAYGSTVKDFTRAANSADYANYERVIGSNEGAGEGAPQLIAEAWTEDANNVGEVPIGLWMSGSNASDVSDPTTLAEKAHGDLEVSSLLVPSYTLTMRPGAPVPNMGDVVPTVLKSGRLNVNTTLRVVGITYVIGDDGQEDVEVTVGRPPLDLTALFTETARDVNALARR
jgi:hypothetical protein